MSAQQQAGSDLGGVSWDEFGQPHCPICNQTLRHEDRVQDATNNGHHNSVYRCTECDIDVISG